MRPKNLLIMLVMSSLGVAEAVAEPFVLFDDRSSHRTDDGGGQTHVVVSGETLAGILLDYFGDGSDIQALIRQTVALNPGAFIRRDPNLLRAGARLKLPPSANTETGAGGDDIYFF